MPEAAAAPLAESVIGEAFVTAAPEMFIPEAAMGSEFGTAAAFEGLGGMEGLGGLSALGSEFGTEALFGGLGETVPTLGEGIAQGVTSGGLGAGEEGINEAMVNAQQAQAVNSGFSQAELDAMQRGQEMAQNAKNLGQFAEGPGGVAEQEAAQNATRELIQNSRQIPPAEDLQGLEQVKEPPLSEAAQRTIEGAKTYGPATNEEFANAQLQAAKDAEAAKYEETIQNLANNGIKQIGSAGVDTTAQDAVRQKLLESSSGPDRFLAQNVPINAQPMLPPGGEQMRDVLGGQPAPYEYVNNTAYGSSLTGTPTAAPSALESGFNQAIDFAKKNPFSAASMAYTGYSLLNKNKKNEGDSGPAPYNGILSKYKISPDFQGKVARPEDYQYATKTYADGGIASFKSGGSTDPGAKLAMDYYESMQRQQAQHMPSTHSDEGIYYDLDPDTRYLDPVTAAQVRMAKINKRSSIQAANMKRPMGLGQINLSPPGGKAQESGPTTDAAHGGIMHSGLGGYAAGGNPRLLRGPGDGMSDNIPATIAGKQPARLADGEFVVPADVVSHLGNGSTEAGAKILHEMMTKVRKERTGNPKQGKQINPRKFVPT